MRRSAGSGLALTVLCAVLNSAGSAVLLEQQGDKPTRVVLLGTGNPNADPDRSGPSVAIVVNDVPYIVDCGPGVVRRASAATLRGISSLAARNPQPVVRDTPPRGL